MNFRERIFRLVGTNENIGTDSRPLLGKVYDRLMLVFIILSLVPLAFREHNLCFEVLDKVSVTVFIIDYLLRWLTADLQMPDRKRWKAFLIYPVTPFAIIDLLSIIPSFTLFNRVLKMLRITRLLKILRVVRFFRYSEHMQMLLRVLNKERKILFTVFLLAIAYIFVTALIMFNIEESELFEDFFDALYWATTTLTTVGYGDIYPGSDLGRVISMLSAIFGVAVIALPSGVITASYLDELREEKKRKSKPKSNQEKADNE